MDKTERITFPTNVDGMSRNAQEQLTEGGELDSEVLQSVVSLVDHKNIEDNVVLVHVNVSLSVDWVWEASQLRHLNNTHTTSPKLATIS